MGHADREGAKCVLFGNIRVAEPLLSLQTVAACLAQMSCAWAFGRGQPAVSWNFLESRFDHGWAPLKWFDR